MSFFDSEATRSTLTSVSTTLSANINASQNYIPVTSTSGFSTSVDAEIETTNEVVSFDTITKNFQPYSQDLSQSNYTKRGNCTVTANFGIAPDGTNTSNLISNIQGNNTPGGTYSDIFDVITTDYSTSGQPLEASFFIKRVSGSSTELFFSNPSNAASGNWKINFNSLSTTEFTRIDKNHPAVTVVNTYESSSSGQAGTHFRVDSSSSANLSFEVWGIQVEAGSSVTGYLPTEASARSGLTTVTRGVNGTTAQAASSGDAIQQLPFAFQKVTAGASTTTTAAINATQDFIPVTSLSGFSTGVATTVAGTNEQFSFATVTTQKLKNTDFSSNWPLRRATKTTSAGTAPDGTNTAVKITPTAVAGTHRIDQNPASLVTSTQYTFSAFGKQDGYTGMSLTVGRGDNLSDATAYFDLATGAVGTVAAGVTATMQNAGGGWYRCIITLTTPNPVAVDAILIGVGTNVSTFNFTGNASDGIQVWGPQLELTSGVTGFLANLTTSTTYPGFTTVTRGINATTAQSALSGVAVSQAASFTTINAPIRLYALSVCSDGGGAGRLTLCDQNGDSLCDVDFPDDKIYDLDFGGGIVFPNGIYVSNTDNLTSYTLFTDKIKGGNLTPGG